MKNWLLFLLLAVVAPTLATVAGCSGQPGEVEPVVVTEEEIQENQDVGAAPNE